MADMLSPPGNLNWKGVSKVEESRRLNLVAGIPAGAAASPRREAKRKGMFASCKRRARRTEVLPVPPVRRIAMVVCSKMTIQVPNLFEIETRQDIAS